MHPVLFEIPLFGGIKIHTYGFMIALGFVAALVWIRYRSQREGLSPKKMTDFAFWLIVSGIVGARLVFILVEARAYILDPLAILRVWEGGLVWYGGLMGALVFSLIHLRKKPELPFWKVGDIMAPAAALGHALGRVGCFFAGCCHGRYCDPQAWYGVTFPEGVGSLAPTGITLYPTQLMESLAEMLIFLFLAWRSKKKAFDGQILLLYLIIYSVVRIVLEMFRGDVERKFVIQDWFSTSQAIGLGFIILVTVYLFFRKGRKTG